VSGDSAAILQLQQSSARYFQRPDRGNGSNGLLTDAYDPSLTALRGLGGYARFSRESGNLLWELSVNMRTPGFENNDIAFLSRADYTWMSGNILRQWTKPTNWYRQLFFIVGGQQQFNFDGDLTDRQVQVFGYIQPRNYWEANAFWIHRPEVFDDRLSRGGPVLKRPGINFWAANLSTDRRKQVVVDWFGEAGCDGDNKCDWGTGIDLRVRPASNVEIRFGPSYGHSESGFQYVQSVDDPTATAFDSTRYVFADLEQNSVSFDTRLNITFTPNLTFEVFLQPLIASGQYSRYKEYAAPRSVDRLVYGTDIGTIDTLGTDPETYVIDPDGPGPAASFEVGDPTFTFRSLRGNAVLRWEYLPGSTLYLVWTRSGDSSLTRGAIDLGEDARALFRGPSQNIFLVKVSYWLGL